MKSRIAIIMLIVISCSSNNEWEGSVTIKDGIKQIKNPEKGLWKAKKKLILEKIIEIGANEGDENYILSLPSDLIIDKDKNIYICDAIDNCVKIFNSDGKYLTTIGKKGQGPGELYGASELNIDSNDNLYVYEKGNRRISVFFKNNFVRTIPMIKCAINSFAVTPNGDDIFATPSSSHAIKGIETIPPLLFHFDKFGNLNKSFSKVSLVGKLQDEWQLSFAYVIFYPENSLLCAFWYPYQIEIFDLDGKIKKIITKVDAKFENPPLGDFVPVKMYVPFRSISYKPLLFPDRKIMFVIIDRGNNPIENFKLRDKMRAEGKQFDLAKTFQYFYDLFDAEGRFLQRFSVDKSKGLLRYIDIEGYGYSISVPESDELPKVCKYKIKFE